jgi:hypothetical protein
MRICGLDDAKSGPAQRGIDSQHDLPRTIRGGTGSQKDGARRPAGNAFFHLFEVAKRNSHGDILPARMALQK